MHVCNTDDCDSYVPGHQAVHAGLSTTVGDVKSTGSSPDPEAAALYPGPSSVATSLTSESDEGRHRTHHLYGEGPKADGLYHCPYKATDSNCPHKPTKLKCNYEYDTSAIPHACTRLLLTTFSNHSKFIDSHLKPFRCKIEACAKQEFSSTACLLRHEREAHGMHGHGERPHLCYYAGCERGIPGNGFPRRYNLFDHMKRVHDHKDEPVSSTASPVVAEDSQGPKKVTGRKRKASASPPMEPAAQRSKAMPLPTHQAQPLYPQAPMYVQQPVYEPPQVRTDQHRQRIYSHWASQKDLLFRQLHSVASPDDEANLQRVNQGLAELRRLSEEAKRR